jgi:hypothetical protein
MNWDEQHELLTAIQHEKKRGEDKAFRDSLDKLSGKAA